MPGQMRITFKGFSALDRRQFMPVQLPGFSSSPAQDKMLRTATGTLAGTSGLGRQLQAALDMITAPSGVITVVGSIPGATIRSPRPDYTLTLGITAGAGALVGVNVGGGMYFWNRPPRGEVGGYFGVGGGVINNVSASFGPQYCVMFGTPSAVLKGNCVAVTVDVTVNGGMLGVSGVVFTTIPTIDTTFPFLHFDVIGVGIAMTIGKSISPVDISIEPSHTWISGP